MNPLPHQPLYDLPGVYNRMRTPKGDIAYYQDLASGAQGYVLELGCGSGRLTVPMAETGAAITGIDLSAAMLSDAVAKIQANPNLNIRLVQADMRYFELDERYDRVFITFNALQHLLDNDSIRACLARVKAHLAPGGMLAFDVLNPHPSVLAGAAEPYEVDTFPHPDGEHTVRVLENVFYDRSTQVAEIELTFLNTDAEGLEVGRETMVQTLRMFGAVELVELLESAGWRLIERFGDFDRQPFGPNSNRMLCWAEPS